MSDDTSPMFTSSRDIYTVSRLNREVRSLLEGSFALLWIEGEISNFACPSSGHWYFSLKDGQAQVRCAMFRNRNQHVGFRPENGRQVLLRCRVSLYENRGEFQLIAEHMEETGHGELQRAFEALRNRLDQEGLFDAQQKQALPEYPQCLGVITSPTGAAIRDVLSVLKKRFPALPVIIYPAPVQGDKAAQQLAAALQLAERRNECDVLLLTRGGGSLEDLWAFNEEVLARAIYHCKIPVVSAVGHEIDFTIADFVADYRAPTPSAAAEQLSPDQAAWQQALTARLSRLVSATHNRLQYWQHRFEALSQRHQRLHPGTQLKQSAQRLDELELRFRRAQQQQIQHLQSVLARLRAQLHQHAPDQRLRYESGRLLQLSGRLRQSMQQTLKTAASRMTAASRELHTVSPLATLERGYSILQDQDQQIIRRPEQVKPGEPVTARLAGGELRLRVESS